MKVTNLAALALVFVFVPAALAAPIVCGTIGTPVDPCNITVGNIQYSLSDVTLLTNNATGGATPYSEDDINVSIDSPAGTQFAVTFSPNPQGPGSYGSFFVNGGDTRYFIVSYDVTATSLVPGSYEFVSPVNVFRGSVSAPGDGFGAIQFITNGGEGGCLLALTTETSESCDLAAPASFFDNAGNITQLSANDGNIALSSFRNVWDVAFTEASGVPEPSGFALVGLGLALLPLARRIRKT